MSDEKNFWDKLQAIDRRWLYGILLILTSAGLFIPVEIPVRPDKSSIDLYVELTKISTDKVILVQSDWTNSTRGENAGHFEALVRFLMARGYKFVVYSYADPQAPQVSRDALARVLQERKDAGLFEYREWYDYLNIGYFPNAEAQTVALDNDIRTAWGTKKIRNPVTKSNVSVFDSPVLENIKSVDDAGFLMIVTASNTIDIAVERLSDNVIPLGCMCTGVVGPSVMPYHQAGQVVGIAIGLKGVYDFEYMMHYGINVKDSSGTMMVKYKDQTFTFDKLEEGVTFGRGKSYFATLHVALILLILAVIVGNVGLAMSKRARKA